MILRPGAQFGRYEIVALLGAGGMGQVYRARDPSLNRQVAVKVIAEAYAQNPSFRDRFRREARTLAALSHPNIATIYSVEEAEGILALTMELVEGQNLADIIRPGGIATDRLLRYGMQIAEAIAAAHDRGITHRDLKPANVIVSSDGRVKVLDFGLARLAASGGPFDSETAPPLSEINSIGFRRRARATSHRDRGLLMASRSRSQLTARLTVFSFPTRSTLRHRLRNYRPRLVYGVASRAHGNVLFQGVSRSDLLVADLSSQNVRRVLSVAPQMMRGASITRDGTQLVVSAGSEDGDIWMATLPPSR